MARDPNRRVREAANGVLVEGERITSQGVCWGAQTRPRVPLLFLARRQYLMALTDRRILLFARRRRGPRASELVIGKRYETFVLEKVRRRRPLMQVHLRATNGNVMVFEFRPGQRELGGELIARLTPSANSTPSHLMSSLGTAPAAGSEAPTLSEPAPAPTAAPTPLPAPTGLIRGGSAADITVATKVPPPDAAERVSDIEPPEPDTRVEDPNFWGKRKP